jgi:hypothetical protein
MQYSVIIMALFGALTVQAARTKVNEYKSGDGSGPLNFGHFPSCQCVSMDATTNSAYIVAGVGGEKIYGFTDGSCGEGGGNKLGEVAEPININTHWVVNGTPVRANSMLVTGGICTFADDLLDIAKEVVGDLITTAIDGAKEKRDEVEGEFQGKRSMRFRA